MVGSGLVHSTKCKRLPPGRLLYLAAVVLVFGVAACVANLDRFLFPSEGAEPGAIKHKVYHSPPLPISQLKALLEMSVYREAPERYGELVMRRTTSQKGMDPVLFSHRSHRARYTCRVCHLELEFGMKKDGTDISKRDLVASHYCGECHDGAIAFSVKGNCGLCHQSEASQEKVLGLASYKKLAATLPRTKHGDRIDWGRAVAGGSIRPAAALRGEASLSRPLPAHLERPLRWSTNTSGVYVMFSHRAHIVWLDCANCHPAIFDLKHTGTIAFDKEKNLYGMYCGSCHMTVAFPSNSCGRCHPGQRDWP